MALAAWHSSGLNLLRKKSSKRLLEGTFRHRVELKRGSPIHQTARGERNRNGRLRSFRTDKRLAHFLCVLAHELANVGINRWGNVLQNALFHTGSRIGNLEHSVAVHGGHVLLLHALNKNQSRRPHRCCCQ